MLFRSPVKESGWYKVIVEAESGKVSSDEIYFDGENPNSQQISLLNLKGENMELRLWGYGEEMAIKDIRLPFEGDHWWYPQNEFWEIEASFEGHIYLFGRLRESKRKVQKGIALYLLLIIISKERGDRNASLFIGIPELASFGCSSCRL